jgi:hypothetical protein
MQTYDPYSWNTICLFVWRLGDGPASFVSDMGRYGIVLGSASCAWTFHSEANAIRHAREMGYAFEISAQIITLDVLVVSSSAQIGRQGTVSAGVSAQAGRI